MWGLFALPGVRLLSVVRGGDSRGGDEDVETPNCRHGVRARRAERGHHHDSNAAGAAAATAAPVVPTLTQVSAAHHYGYDQLVFQFRGGVPAKYSARYVSQVIRDASGLPVNVVGSALLQVRFTPAAGHNEKGIVTYGAMQRTYALPEIIQVVNAGDFESVLSFGVGLAQRRAVPHVRPAHGWTGSSSMSRRRTGPSWSGITS